MSNNSSKEKVDAWTSAQLGELLDNANPDELRSIRASGLLPDQVAKVLAILENNYDPDWDNADFDYDNSEDPRHVENTEIYKEIVVYWTTQVLNKAVRVGNDRIINRFVRIVNEESKISDVHPVLRFARWVTRRASVTYLAGHMGSGKTDFALLMLEIFYKEMKESDTGVKIATNIKSTAENEENVEYISSQPELVKWLEEDDKFKMFLFDEASSHASGYSGEAHIVQKQMRSMIRLIRKHNGNMIIIGHDGKDLHPTIRELADYVEKEDKKEAAVFEAVRNREGEDQKFELEAIPKTNLYYDTKEATTWEWATDEDEDGVDYDKIIGRCYATMKDHGYTQKEVGDIFEVTQSKVSSAYQEYKSAEA